MIWVLNGRPHTKIRWFGTFGTTRYSSLTIRGYNSVRRFRESAQNRCQFVWSSKKPCCCKYGPFSNLKFWWLMHNGVFIQLSENESVFLHTLQRLSYRLLCVTAFLTPGDPKSKFATTTLQPFRADKCPVINRTKYLTRLSTVFIPSGIVDYKCCIMSIDTKWLSFGAVSEMHSLNWLNNHFLQFVGMPMI